MFISVTAAAAKTFYLAATPPSRVAEKTQPANTRDEAKQHKQ